MRHFLYFSIVIFLGVTFLISCNKDDGSNTANSNIEFFDFGTFKLSLVDNILVFRDQEDLDACFEYLDSLDNDEFDAFEESINYISYRRYFINIDEDLRIFDEDLYATLMNPDGEIIVGNHLLKDTPLENKITIYQLDPNFNISNKTLIKDIDRDEDVFEVIENGYVLKSSPSQCKNNDTSTIKIYDFSQEISIRTRYNNGIVKYLDASISRPWCIGCGITLRVETRPGIEKTFWIRDQKNSYEADCDVRRSKTTTGRSENIRIKEGKLTAYNFVIDYTVIDETLSPYPKSETYNGSIWCKPETSCGQ